ncbi:hypothetical protein CAAN3_04S08504 [[Candida] anglica]
MCSTTHHRSDIDRVTFEMALLEVLHHDYLTKMGIENKSNIKPKSGDIKNNNNNNNNNHNNNNKKQNKQVAPLSGSLKDIEKRRRQVYKPVLDNPYTQSNLWPFVEPEVSETLLELLSHLFSNVGSYNKVVASGKDKPEFVKPEEPEILRNGMTLGFNSTVGALERQAKKTTDILNGKTGQEENNSKYIKYVLVTKFDITPSLLVQHFPVLACTASKSKEDRVKLVQLPRGASKRLSDMLNISNVTIIGLTSDIRAAQGVYDLIDNKVDDVNVPWLEQMLAECSKVEFSKPVLKVLSTSAPIFPKKNDQKKKNKESKQVENKEEGSKEQEKDSDIKNSGK